MTKKNLGTPSRVTTSLMVRLDPAAKAEIIRAAELRKVSVSDYVRTVMAEQARLEIEASEPPVTRLAPADQLAFWNALNTPAELNEGQKRLAAIIRNSTIVRSPS